MTRRRKLRLPGWWPWDLFLSGHVERRMAERGFTEVDLRAMLHAPATVRPGQVAGRFEVDCTLRGRRWLVVVEPLANERMIVVITAYAPE